MSFDPESANQWLGLGAGMLAIMMWIKRHVLCALCKFIINMIKGPQRIEDILKLIQETRFLANRAEAMARMQWRCATNPIFHFDPVGLCLGANVAMCKLLARQEDEIVGHGWRSLLADEDRNAVVEEFERVIRHRRDFHMTFRWTNAGNEDIKAICHAYRMVSLDGMMLGWVGYLTPVDM